MAVGVLICPFNVSVLMERSLSITPSTADSRVVLSTVLQQSTLIVIVPYCQLSTGHDGTSLFSTSFSSLAFDLSAIWFLIYFVQQFTKDI